VGGGEDERKAGKKGKGMRGSGEGKGGVRGRSGDR